MSTLNTTGSGAGADSVRVMRTAPPSVLVTSSAVRVRDAATAGSAAASGAASCASATGASIRPIESARPRNDAGRAEATFRFMASTPLPLYCVSATEAGRWM